MLVNIFLKSKSRGCLNHYSEDSRSENLVVRFMLHPHLQCARLSTYRLRSSAACVRQMFERSLWRWCHGRSLRGCVADIRGCVADIKRESEAFEIGHSNVGSEALVAIDQGVVLRVADPQIGRCLNEVLSANKRWIFLIARPCHKLMNAVLDVFMRSYAHHRATLVRPRPVERRPKDFRKRTT